MKVNKTLYLFLVVFVMTVITLACGSGSEPEQRAWAAPTDKPYVRPTERPIESSCVTPAMYKQLLNTFYPWITLDFSRIDSTWDMATEHMSDPYTKVMFSYNVSGGCVESVGVVTSTNWNNGNFERSGEYIASIVSIDQGFGTIEWVQEKMMACIDADQDDYKLSNGQETRFICENNGTSVIVAVAIHLH